MLKQISFSRIGFASIILLLLLLFSIFPKRSEYGLNLEKNISVEYIKENFLQEIFLLDNSNYIARTSVLLTEKTTEKKIREILTILIKEGEKMSLIPSGFQPIIPVDTRILGIDLLDDGVVKINLSQDFLDVNEEYEEKIVSAIVYSLTSLKDIKGVILYVENELLSVLPKSNIKLPSLLTRDFGINKTYNLINTSNIKAVNVYYINSYDDNYYYVPVTKYSNDERDKIKIIIEELTSGPIYETNLMSFISSNVELLSYEQQDKSFFLNFNKYIFDDIKDKKILEEVLYTISLSIGDSYNVQEIIFLVDNEEIEKSVIGSIE